MSTIEMDNPTPAITVVELHMMDKYKFYPLTAVSGFFIRGALYPFSLIKTRIQIQKKKAMYTGTFDAFRKISKFEGVRGLYKGFWVSNLLIVPQLTYLTTYEGMRHYLAHNTTLKNNKIRSFISGGCASLAGQTFIVPIDIVSQHLMLMSKSKTSFKTSPVKVHQGNPLELDPAATKSRYGATVAVVKAVYKRDGLVGFYRGFIPSACVYGPNNALWWFFYDHYCDLLGGLAPNWVPRLVLQCTAAPMGGVSAALIMNPMDIIRARTQVENTKFFETGRQLWNEERLGIFTKGLSARLIQSIVFSFCIILGYESIKRVSLKPEYKNSVRW